MAIKKLYLCDGDACDREMYPHPCCIFRHPYRDGCYHTTDENHRLSSKFDDFPETTMELYFNNTLVEQIIDCHSFGEESDLVGRYQQSYLNDRKED